MRLSESIRRSVLATGGGSIVNRFQIDARRNVLFFEEVLADYVAGCEDLGFGDEMYGLGKTWTGVSIQQLVPKLVRRLGAEVIVNRVLNKTWRNLGLMGDVHLSFEPDSLILDSRDEFITRYIGENRFAQGVYVGIVSSLTGRDLECVESSQGKSECRYVFRENGRDVGIVPAKEKKVYRLLNSPRSSRGLSMEKAIRSGLFTLDSDNRLSFRGNRISPFENTLLHLVGGINFRQDVLYDLLRAFFDETFDEAGGTDEKLVFTKSIGESMGWGTINIIVDKDRAKVILANPPYGLQAAEDNWEVFKTAFGAFLDSDFEKVETEVKQIVR